MNRQMRRTVRLQPTTIDTRNAVLSHELVVRSLRPGTYDIAAARFYG